jgi:hypothetical protein
MHCLVEYLQSPHLNQVYVGFDLLAKQKRIELEYKAVEGLSSKPIIRCILNNKIIIYYDMLDGLNWIDGSLNKNFEHFSKYKGNYYFKRSFTPSLQSFNQDLSIHPFGFNFYLSHNNPFRNSVMQMILKYRISMKDFESTPAFYFKKSKINKTKKRVIFFTRLWDPRIEKNINKQELDTLNNTRISIIETCKREFSNYFIGGLEHSAFSKKMAAGLVAPRKYTARKNYLSMVNDSSIAIATTGLHGSIGWKMAEYVALGKAIISEPLNFELPGNFSNKDNFLEFTDTQSLCEQIEKLLSSPSQTKQIQENNFIYGKKYMQPAQQIYSSLVLALNSFS